MEGTSFEDIFGEDMGAVKSEVAGTVLEVTPSHVKIRGADRKVHYAELYENHPYNRKSLTGDTVIMIRRGDALLRLPIADYVWRRGDTVLTTDPETKEPAWLPVTAYTKHRNDKQLLRIQLRSGRAVTVTEDHSLMVMGDGGALVPYYPADVIIGTTRLPVAMPCISADGEDTQQFTSGVLAGLYLAEGHCPPAQPGHVILAVEPDARAAEVLQLLEAFDAYRNGGAVCFTHHATAKWLVAEFGHLSGNKRIPPWVLVAHSAFRRGLIAGYMAGDGNLWVDKQGGLQLTGVSTSRTLRDHMVDVLGTFGVFTTLFDAPRQHLNENWNDAYGFRVINEHIPKLAQWFFYTDREQQLQSLLKPVYRASPFSMVPIPQAARKLLYAGYDNTPAYIHKTAGNGAVSKQRLVDNDGVFGQWGRSTVMWDTVVEIQPVPHEEYVYDLSVARAEAFCAGHGIVVHNTFVHNRPVVRPGDRVKPGQLLAASNFTDDGGTTALGKNARVAYIPYKGYNFEDAIVISEGFAQRSASEHMYQNSLDLGEGVKASKNAFLAIYPGEYDRKLLDKYDADGVVNIG
jgi:hypothetical protein